MTRFRGDGEWLSGLDTGALVVIYGGGFRNDLTAAKVDRSTKTMLVVGGRRYRRSDGREIGGSAFYSHHLAEPTPERLDRIRRTNLAAAIRRATEGVSKSQLPTETLAAIRAAVQPLLDERSAAGSRPGDEQP